MVIAIVLYLFATRNFSRSTNPNVPPPDQSLVGDTFTGILKGKTDSWSFMTLGKYAESFKLTFPNSSVCTVDLEKGPCFALQAYFGQGNTTTAGGGDTVEIIGQKSGDTIQVNSLTLKENFVANGTLVKNGDSLIFKSSAVGTLAMKFDSQSACLKDSQALSSCDLSSFQNGVPIFIHALLYKNALLVRQLVVITQTAPTSSVGSK